MSETETRRHYVETWDAETEGSWPTATAVQNPLTSLADDVAHTRRILALQDGPTILAGHSFCGTVISEAGVDTRTWASCTSGLALPT